MLFLKDPSQLTNKQETHTYADHHFHQPFNAFQVGDSDLVPGRFRVFPENGEGCMEATISME